MKRSARLEQWIDRRLTKREQMEVATFGCTLGPHSICYAADNVRLFKRYADDCLRELQKYVEKSAGTYPPMLKNWLSDFDRCANFLFWFAVESIINRKLSE